MTLEAEDLERLESSVSAAFRDRDHSQLNIIGFGELTVALGFPSQDPTHVCKRSGTMSSEQFESYESLVNRYTAGLAERGVSVVDTEVHSTDRGSDKVAYLVQPLLDSATLGHNVLGSAKPDHEHPFLVALGERIKLADDRLSIDAQVTNWAFDGSEMTLIDVGTPFMWDAAGRYEMDMRPSLAMLPAPVRSYVAKDLTKILARWRSQSGVASDVVANLYREGLDEWAEPAARALNIAIGPAEPVDIGHARKLYEDDLKLWPQLAKLKRVQRTWQSRVRRKPYEFFIQSTYVSSSDVEVTN